MYDPLETGISKEELNKLFSEIRNLKIKAGLVGGWAAYFYANEGYKRAFGRDYMSSRDIDIFFEPQFDEQIEKLLKKLKFEKDGFKFRYEKVYDRETKSFITEEDSKKKNTYDLIYIFLDLFSNAETKKVGTWWELPDLKKAKIVNVNGMELVDFNTLIAMKCTAIFARDKADKEVKDACDLYALLLYGNQDYEKMLLLRKALEKLLSRNDLLYAIAEHVLLDPSRQNIASAALQNLLKKFA
jgi:hypothetical protein